MRLAVSRARNAGQILVGVLVGRAQRVPPVQAANAFATTSAVPSPKRNAWGPPNTKYAFLTEKAVVTGLRDSPVQEAAHAKTTRAAKSNAAIESVVETDAAVYAGLARTVAKTTNANENSWWLLCICRVDCVATISPSTENPIPWSN